ncbi:MAG: tetraacyldisaccharide 4'-kinase [Rhodocyclaceae bacterium]|nr:tetraacyldisaccharide 4'-kinase [Rhodocyclaceae bacterium]MDZ4215639.1 tetraacyldisaccharide 4'-kinase [Rhodocyclaceae bacterium]
MLPVGWLFFALVRLRRLAYQRGWLRSKRLPVPVIVIGNLVVGGAGKTPLTLWLAQHMRSLGRKPGIVSRGYGRTDDTIQKVGAGRTASEVGDEPLLLAQRSGCPVFVGADRGAAAAALLGDHPECDVILCDDGLQHLQMARDVEILVMDRRGLMNGWPLPAGPLREPVERVSRVDALVLHNNDQVRVDGVPTFQMHLAGSCFYRLNAPEECLLPAALQGLRLAAFAGIGEPQRFFDHLTALGLSFESHAFLDHHRYTRADFSFTVDALLTTEKDALKCEGLTDVPIWVLPVEAVVEPDLAHFVLEKIDGCTPA